MSQFSEFFINPSDSKRRKIMKTVGYTLFAILCTWCAVEAWWDDEPETEDSTAWILQP